MAEGCPSGILVETSHRKTAASETTGMEGVESFVSRSRWPTGFAKSISDSKNRVAHRFVLIDNSCSMLKQDGYRLAVDRHGVHR